MNEAEEWNHQWWHRLGNNDNPGDFFFEGNDNPGDS